MCDDCIMADFEEEIEELTGKLNKALDAMRAVEFVHDPIEDCNQCPWCLEYELVYLPNRNHAPNCIWMKTLEECDPNYVPDPIPESKSTMCNP